MDFQDRTVVITGAAGNLGRAVAGAFARRGARLALVAREREQLAQAYGEEHERMLFASADLTQLAEVEAAVHATLQRCGRIDVLCNLAGAFRMGTTVHETTDADWNLLFDANMKSMLHMARAIVPAMIAAGGGKIVNVAASSAGRGLARMGAYCASKDTVIRITESMAAELREKGINVNCVLPSIIDTPENRAAMPNADPSHWVDPDALADTILFLASDAARAIHGAALPVVGLS
ncbi:SDR family NAD(P)-dependent oxidoreductase [Noviherbaspirillum pedocola]|uniref:SDR family NAD(P)-dependent oxidoreductase n=1 Tax=Noviherbaspirillum pedocola TaxID=2801341 RepID=A0A934SWN0_9BURK|nr:SDR family NAD(P)-dependent oxidoreductase [Noviherbaspirillum pedocola]MBK4736730.1 SDR family NAD(P)-dependent oxidoreductase [Noviherbaspirillum pedocola]